MTSLSLGAKVPTLPARKTLLAPKGLSQLCLPPPRATTSLREHPLTYKLREGVPSPTLPPPNPGTKQVLSPGVFLFLHPRRYLITLNLCYPLL